MLIWYSQNLFYYSQYVGTLMPLRSLWISCCVLVPFLDDAVLLLSRISRQLNSWDCFFVYFFFLSICAKKFAMVFSDPTDLYCMCVYLKVLFLTWCCWGNKQKYLHHGLIKLVKSYNWSFKKENVSDKLCVAKVRRNIIFFTLYIFFAFCIWLEK